ncbi:hypothetical protein [Winogradskyella endarachnes]|uniref:DUF748 domain-containing protein n=1 Tax=Winogradskyella endarachnes TaxID=2681965 RepID=A0A6L6U8S4_9FLAO|nr:hypothetical protein [Winogradskyella endarachnes]MUU78429.1 hypothetical protein [Winogradskyella endarachnes]
MIQKHKKTLINLSVIILVAIVVTLWGNYAVERQIKKVLQGLPKTIQLQYTSIKANIWTGNVAIKLPQLSVIGEITDQPILNAELKTIEIKDIGYYDFLINDQISINYLILDQLVVNYKYNPKVKRSSYNKGILEKLKQIIHVEKVDFNNADVLVLNSETDSTLLSLPKFNFELKELQIQPEASNISNKIKFKDFKVSASNVKWAMNTFDDLFANTIEITDDYAVFNEFQIKTKYNRQEYSKILNVERDHFQLNIKQLKLNDLDYGFNIENSFYLTSKEMNVVTPETEIYRDKLVTDDLKKKPLYSQLLRDLDFNLNIHLVEITNGKIAYLEKVNEDKSAGRLDFTNLNATIVNLGNINGSEETQIKVNSTFMDNSSLAVRWDFKVNDNTDQFSFKADLGLFNADQLDQFTNANLNIDLNGQLQQTYFTISGNKKASRVDLKMKYNDFEVAILKKNGKEKNRLLSKLVNLIVSKNSNETKNNFRYGQDYKVERDVTKSVFNYIWLNVKQGLLAAMTGKGVIK